MVSNLKLSTSSQCIKYLLFIFNLLFVITGIILLSIGSAIHGYYYNYAHFLDDRFFSVPSLLIAIGAIIFFIAFFGCCGAVRENYCMIVTFTAFLVVVFILEFSAGISGYVLRGSVSEVLERKMKGSMSHYSNSTEIAGFWDEIQRDFDCCGYNGAGDWASQIQNKTAPNSLPMSCCSMPLQGEVGQTFCALNSTNLHQHSCAVAFGTFLKSHAVQLGGAGLTIAFMQALGIWFSIYLARSIKRNYDNM